MVDISIIIVSFNSEKFISKCLESISKCFRNTKYEIIVVDNSSKDGTVDLLNKKKSVYLIENDKNLGYAKACNQGARVASGKFLFFTNADIEFEDNIPAKIFIFLLKNKDFAGGGFAHLHRSGRIQRICAGYLAKPFDHLSEQLGFYGLFPSVRIFNSRFFALDEYQSDHPAEFISGGSFLIKKEVFFNLFGFDEKFFAYFEDMDLCQRLKKRGYKLFYWGSLRVIHSLGTERSQITSLSLKSDYASRYYYFEKHYSSSWIPLLWLTSNIGLVARFSVYTILSLYKILFYKTAKNYFNVFLSHLNLADYAK
jgi:hypothetical protein